MVFRWVFIPWLQRELDAYQDRVNNTAKRADKNKLLPHGVPNDIYENPEDFGILDFKIHVEKAAIDYVRSLYAPQDHPVFQLVPPTFAIYATQLYQAMGAPDISRDNVWEVYLVLLDGFHELEDIPEAYHIDWYRVAITDEPEPLELVGGLRELANGQDHVDEDGNYYMGGVNNGVGLDEHQLRRMNDLEDQDEPVLQDNPQDPEPELVVDFTDEEEEDEW
ncbi:hypothetical protein H0H92_004418 [Tricholoma furcatifolium]|nr:hypothetical protein H0H92_004418 [Tricholoma furcatifolium]